MATVKQLRERWEQEPGKTVLAKLLAFFGDLGWPNPRPAPPMSDLYQALEGLPYREEVPFGKDLRAAPLGGIGWEVDLPDFDFSYADFEGGIFANDLSRTRFDYATNCSGISTILRKASFRKVKFRQCYFLQTQAQECCFDEADLKESRFGESDLTGSSFRGANCKNVNFEDTILVGCDFQGADLTGAVFSGAKLDPDTDFRGANLTNADWEPNRHGEPAVNWRIAKYDQSTLTGTNLIVTALEEIQATRIALEAYFGSTEPKVVRLDGLLQELLQALPKKYVPTWREEVLRRMGKEHQDFVEHVFSLGYKYMDLVD